MAFSTQPRLSKFQLLHYTEPKRRMRQGGQFVVVVLHTPDHHPVFYILVLHCDGIIG